MILSTSDTKRYGKIALGYLVASVFLGLFGAVYEYFSFGVYSYYMLYAFGFPLVGGVLPALLLSLQEKRICVGAWAAWLYRCGIATLSVGSIMQGVLEIYGTGNDLLRVYWYAGGGLTLLGAICWIIRVFVNGNKATSQSEM